MPVERTKILFSEAKTAIDEGRLEDALLILEKYVEEDIHFIFLKGEVYFRMQKWGDSINCFRKVLEIDPENSRAKTYIEMIRNILSFYHTDLFNP